MALTLTNKWQLVACGLVTHADGVLDGEECDRLMAMVDGHADGEEYASWLSAVADADRLREILEGLPAPPPEDHREILEQAWRISIVDGDRCDAEMAIIEDLARRIGVESVQLEFWRDAWTRSERETAASMAAALGWILGGGAPLHDDDKARLRNAIMAFPTADDHREALIELASGALERDQAVRGLGTLTRRKRRWALEQLAPVVSGSTGTDVPRQRFIELGAELGVAASEADAMLDGRAGSENA